MMRIVMITIIVSNTIYIAFLDKLMVMMIIITIIIIMVMSMMIPSGCS